ncbi:MAG TPA: DHA2 family efflux MFS transporter permease subunit [Steroidobacteraceae bacterium]|nr:DHA2 family efflux MFS transporter permease subunit [Steroidobacteraceae bacterium]
MSVAERMMSGNTAMKGGLLWLTAIELATANFMAVLDMTIANVSVASIAGNLGISGTQGTWVITSYSVAEAIIVPLTGWLAGRFGPVRVFVTAMSLFGMCSSFCGFSNSLAMLVFGRVMQGLAGGSLMPLSQTLLLRIFPKEKAGAAMALWAMTTLVAPVVGPILGGWICDNYTWPMIFFINVPIAIICAPLAWRMLKRFEEAPVRAPIDRIGLALLIIFVGALQLMLDLGKDQDWFESTEICTLAIVAVIGFIAFLMWESGERHPIVNLKVFRHRGFTACAITISIGFGAMFASNVLTPLWLQSFMGYTATWAGMAAAWTGVLAIVGAPIAGGLVTKVDPRKLIFFGLMWLATIMILRTVQTTDMTYWQISIPLLLMGLGLPFFFVPLTALGLGSVEESETASAAGVLNFIRTLSGAVGTSIVTTAWENNSNYMHAELSGLVDRTGELARGLANAGAPHDVALTVMDNLTYGQSVMLSMNELMLFTSVGFVIGALVIWIAPRPSRAVNMMQAGH